MNYAKSQISGPVVPTSSFCFGFTSSILLGLVSTNVKDILKFWGGLLVALLGLVLFVGGGFMPAIFTSSAILLLVGVLLLIVGGYIMYKAWTHHEFDEVVNQ